MQKTTLRQNVTNTHRQWFVVDAAGENLGRLATRIATVLRGKHRVDFTPHVDGGDYVVVLNADKVVVSGSKEDDKMYYSHSGYLGHLKAVKLKDVRDRSPQRILEEAVGGMLPKTKLRKDQMRRLMLVMGSDNPHEAQKAKPLPNLAVN